MNSDASDARKDRAGRGERRYVRLGRESSVQLPGEESWLDELDNYEAEGEELDDDEVRRLVGTVLEDWDEDGGSEIDATLLEVNATPRATPRAAQALGGGRGVCEDVVAGADASLSSIWDESDAFWSSSTPPSDNNNNNNNNKGAVQSASKSPGNLMPKADAKTQGQQTKTKKRHFEVAKDEPQTPTQQSPTIGHARSGKKQRDSYEVKSDRKRSVLGDGTPNVNAKVTINVTSPTMTPGSYYDEQGFLRA